ncbi:hypothetical protein PVK06_042945 [Gossypium arboreum]|uniref:RNase H type-1 domain-containing protein n=1 Tax=Gossypium arboreum TaxID=29729 RepID=A0ABR0MM78_GOSAR|nr:hypothetical protein PVK06_042945 [Gossypium arboreum]
MVARTYPHHGVSDAFVAKARACEQAVTFAAELGFRSIQLEGNSVTIIKKVASSKLDKIANTDAHTLAGEGRRFSVPRYWIEEALEMVEWTAERDRQR